MSTWLQRVFDNYEPRVNDMGNLNMVTANDPYDLQYILNMDNEIIDEAAAGDITVLRARGDLHVLRDRHRAAFMEDLMIAEALLT